MYAPFKLLIYAIVTLALIWFIMTYIAPLFFPTEDPFQKLEEKLSQAESFQGETVEFPLTFSPSTGMKAEHFDTLTRSVAFQCNDLYYCCEKNKKCGKIEWDERSVFFVQGGKYRTNARCGFAHGLYACTVYLGVKPAQLEIKSTPESLEFDFEKQTELKFEIEITNVGEKVAVGIDSLIKVYKIARDIEVKKTFVWQDLKQTENLYPEKTQTVAFTLSGEQLTSDGNYVIEVKVSGRDAGFDLRDIPLEVKNYGATLIKQCLTTTEGEPQIIEVEGEEKCVRKLYCQNCALATLCQNAWEEKLNKELEMVSPEYCYEPLTLLDCGIVRTYVP